MNTRSTNVFQNNFKISLLNILERRMVMLANSNSNVLFVIYENDMVRQASLSYLYDSPTHIGPYVFRHEGRICYPNFDILCEPNTTYKITTTVSDGFPGAQMSVQQFSILDYEKYLLNLDMPNVYHDSWWQSTTYTFTTLSQTKGFRMTFCQYNGSGYTPINPNFRILKIVVTKV